MATAVRKYTTEQLLERMRQLPSFTHLPMTPHIIAVRSTEDHADVYDDKLYFFMGSTFISVMTCTTNSGTYGQRNFHRWNRKGVAVVKSDEIYYYAFEKSDGKSVRHHNGKMECLRQVEPLKYYRDNNNNDRIDEIGPVYLGNYSTNIHANSYKHRTGLWSWLIGRWSVGCVVVNDLWKYYNVLLSRIPLKVRVTLTVLKEF